VVLVCTDAHPLAVVGAGRVLNELNLRQKKGRKGASRWALVLSKIDLRRSMDQALDKQLAKTYRHLSAYSSSRFSFGMGCCRANTAHAVRAKF
jgi:chromosome partitioning protein